MTSRKLIENPGADVVVEMARTMTTRAIADALDVAYDEVFDFLDWRGIRALRAVPPSVAKGTIDRDRLKRMFVDQGLTYIEISRRTGWKYDTIRNTLCKMGFGRPCKRGAPREMDYDAVVSLATTRTVTQVSETLHVPKATIYKALKVRGVKSVPGKI